MISSILIGNNQLANKRHQPLSLLASAIRILEKKPKGEPIPNGYLPKQYARQVRPRSAYMVLKKGPPSIHSTPIEHGVRLNGSNSKPMVGQKQQKTKQKLYMSLINPARIALQDRSFTHNGMNMLHRTHPPTNFPTKYIQPKSNTLPRGQQHNIQRMKMNRNLYMDMIRPVMTSQQFYKLGGNRSAFATPSSQRTLQSRQSNSNQTMTPRPPTENQFQKRLHPNLLKMTPENEAHTKQRRKPPQQKATYTLRAKTPTPQTSIRSGQSSSLSNGFLPHQHLHLPRLKSRDGVSLNSQTRGQIPKAHPENVIPLYFSKSLAYSPQYKRKELITSPL